jgi:hypothetical protein
MEQISYCIHLLCILSAESYDFTWSTRAMLSHSM